MTRQYTDHELMNWRPAKNTGAEVIGPREVCRISGGSDLDRSIVAVGLPSLTVSTKTYAVNGPFPLQPGQFGSVCFGPVVIVAYDADEIPVVNDLYGPLATLGSVYKDVSPKIFRVLRIVDATNHHMLAYLAPESTATASVDRRFILREDLTEGGYAVAEWINYREHEVDVCGPYDDTKVYRVCFRDPDRTFFYVKDSLGEFTGTADLHGGWAWRPDDMPTREQLCIPQGPPQWLDNLWSDDWVWDEDIWDIRRIVCGNFMGSPCQDFDADPCAGPEVP